MIGDADLPRPAEAPAVELNAEHLPQILSLVVLTKPGPFSKRTIELGGY